MDLRSSKAKLFLIELIIIILFFSFAGGICMNMFATAKRMSVRSTDMTNASMVAQAAAETIKNGGEPLLLDTVDVDGSDGKYEVFYDMDWNAVSENEAVYVMNIDVTHQENGILSADVIVGRNMGDELYKITTKRFDGESEAQ